MEDQDEDGVSSTAIRRSRRVPLCPFRLIESNEGSNTDDADAYLGDPGGRTDESDAPLI